MVIKFDDGKINNVIISLLGEFGSHTLEELIVYFPMFTKEKVTYAFNLLLNSNKIVATYDNEERYRLSSVRYDARNKYNNALVFLRSIMSSKDDKGEYINRINYVSRVSFPCTIIFDCNGTLYDLYYIPENDVKTICQLVNRLDLDRTSDDVEPKRIVVTDSSDYFKKIDLKYIVYKVSVNDDGTINYER